MLRFKCNWKYFFRNYWADQWSTSVFWKNRRELGFDYWNKRKSWMNAGLYFAWLKRFNSYIKRNPGKKAILLLDSCGSQRTFERLPRLSNVIEELLQPNTVSRLQLMEAGIDATLKTCHRKLQSTRAFDALNELADSTFKIYQLVVKKYIGSFWQFITSKNFWNFWNTIESCGARITEPAEAGDNFIERKFQLLEHVLNQIFTPYIELQYVTWSAAIIWTATKSSLSVTWL